MKTDLPIIKKIGQKINSPSTIMSESEVILIFGHLDFLM